MPDLIDDPIKGIAFANEMIAKYRMHSEEARLKGDMVLASKYDFYLTKWADILQHFIREAHQEGKTSEELTRSLKQMGEKKRYNAKPRGKGANPTEQPRAVGFGSHPQNMGVAESLRLATPSVTLGDPSHYHELQQTVGKKLDSERKDAPQGDNDSERSDSDSG